jgi:hypothetical protein
MKKINPFNIPLYGFGYAMYIALSDKQTPSLKINLFFVIQTISLIAFCLLLMSIG